MTSRLVCAGMMLIFAAMASAEEPQPIAWRDDVHEALREAHATRRPLLVFMTTDGCSYCTRMKRATFGDRRVSSQISASFVPVAVNSKDHPDLVRQLNARAFPTTALIEVGNPKSKLLDRMVGYVPPASFSRRLSQVEQRTTTKRR